MKNFFERLLGIVPSFVPRNALLMACAALTCLNVFAQTTTPIYLGTRSIDRTQGEYSPVFATYEEALEWTRDWATRPRFGAPAKPIANSLVYYYSRTIASGDQDGYGDPFRQTTTVLPNFDFACSETQASTPNYVFAGGHYIYGTANTFPNDLYYTLIQNCGPTTGFAELLLAFVEKRLVTSTPVSSSKNLGPFCPFCGNPINPATGNKFQREGDYRGTGAMPLEFTRYYNSLTMPLRSMGRQWRHTYERTVYRNNVGTASYATVSRPDGRAYTFKRNGSTWISDGDVNDRLTELLDGSGATTGWSHYLAAGDITEAFDSAGRLISITARDGFQHLLTYQNGQIAQVTDSFGRTLSFAYDAGGRLSQLTDPAGNQYQYAYDANGMLSSVLLPDGKSRSYLYNEQAYTSNTNLPSALTGITDENGARFATYQYDTAGRAVSTEHANATNKYIVAYTNINVAANAIDPTGSQRTYNFSNVQGTLRNTSIAQPCSTSGCTGTKSETRGYDANGNLTSRIDFNGNLTCFAYDTARNLEITRVEGLSSSASCATALAGTFVAPARRILTTWHSTFRLPATITEPTSAGNRVTTFSYDASGNLLAKSVAVAGQTRTWTWTYDTFGRVLTATDPRNNTTTNTYYANNTLQGSKRGLLATATNAAGHATTISDYSGHGLPLSITDANGIVTSLSYDSRQRLTSRSVGGEVTGYEYDGVGQLVKVTTPDGSYLSYAYDTAHRLVEISDSLGNKVTYTLDNLGNRTGEAYKDPSGALARTRTRAYDALNRLQQDIGGTNPAAQITQYRYDDNGNVTSTIDPLNRTTSQSYDALNRLLQVLDPVNGSAAPTKYEYDAQDNLIQVTDPKNLATSYTYNGFNELLAQASPDTGSTSFTYDAAGNLATKTDSRGVVVTYTYDALNRVVTVAYPAFGIDPAETVTYSYDSCVNGKGQLCSITDKTGTTSYAYNSLGRVASKSQTVLGLTQTIGYAYNGAGQLTSVTYPSGAVIGYGYQNNRITSVTVNGEAVLQQAEYEPFGPVGEWLWGNSTPQAPNRHTRYFDLDGRNTKIASIADMQPTVIVYDAASRITDLQKVASTGSADSTQSFTYGYDNLDRLISALPNAGNANPARSFSYDGVGNRLTSSVAGATTNYVYGTSSHRLIGLSGATANTYTYDNAGNRIGDSTAVWVYGGNNRPVRVTAGGAVTDFSINALGQRVRKSSSLGATRFVYDEAGRLVGEYSDTGARKTETVWFNDLPVAVMK